MIDSHVHLNRPEFADEVEAVLARAREAGVTGLLNVGYDLATSRESIVLAAAHPWIRATVGVHPHDAESVADADGAITSRGREVLAELEDLAARDEVVAVGEIGLDFFRDLSPRPAQFAALNVQLELADRLGLPVVFHVRDAWREILRHLDEVGPPRAGGVLHAFSGDVAAVDWARDRGFLLGIGGPVTYKKSHLPELVIRAGVELLLLETDAPWLPPEPHRGQRNESALMVHTRDRIASLLDLTADDVVRHTTASFVRVFGPLAGTDAADPDAAGTTESPAGP